MREKIIVSDDPFIEKLAHEIAMIYVAEDYKRKKRVDFIANCKDEGWMLNAYYQAKRRALSCLEIEYEVITK